MAGRDEPPAIAATASSKSHGVGDGAGRRCGKPGPGGEGIVAEVVDVVLLTGAVAGALGRPFGMPSWVAPLLATVVALATGLVPLSAAEGGVKPLAQALAFLLAAVPLSVLVDRMGLFSAIAERLPRGRRLEAGLWWMAAVVVAVLNLDAAVALLTPLYLRIAGRQGLDPWRVAAMPVLLACLASSVLPVSNLTNLIAVARTGASPAGFVAHLGLPSLAASAAGLWLLRRWSPRGRSTEGGSTPVAPPAPSVPTRMPSSARVALVVVVVAVVGFVLGPSVGVQAWMVALGADVVLVVATRAAPLRSVPLGTAVVAAALGVLAGASAARLHLGDLLAAHSLKSIALTSLVAGAAANVVNNLPATLVALATGPHRVTPGLWPLLLGVNMGPTLLLTGSLASLLWADGARAAGLEVHWRDYLRLGVRVGMPAFLVGLVTLLALSALTGR